MNRVLSYLIFGLILTSAMGQHSPVRFQSLSINDGLSLSSVYCIYRDSKGFMWFGTEDGLNRFDGYHFKIYRTDVKNSNSICYKWIEHIVEDNGGRLWFGSRNGLSCFDPRSETFTNLNRTTPLQLSNDTITCLHAFNQLMLVGTMDGLHLIDSSSPETIELNKVGRVYDICSDDKNCFVASDKGFIWMDKTGSVNSNLNEIHVPVVDLFLADSLLYCSTAQSVFVFNTDNGSLKTIRPFEKKYANERIENCLVDNEQRIWISNRSGLFLHHIKKGWTKKLVTTLNTTNSLAINTNKSLSIDENGTVWYATHGDGLFLVSAQLQVTKCVFNPADNASISQNAFNCVYNDKTSGNIWLGTYGAGINVYHPNANKFDLIKHNPLNKNSLSSNFVWSVFEAADSCLWIGTNDKGVCRYCPITNIFTNYAYDARNKNSISHNSVRKVYEDSKGTIWLGTDGGGLNRYLPAMDGFQHYRHDPGDPNSISDNSVRVIFEDSRQRLWIGTRNGLNMFDKKEQRFIRYMHQEGNPASLSNNFIYASIMEDKEGMIWVGTYGGGLNKLNPETGVFERYASVGDDHKRLSDNIVFSLYEDKDGLLWVGTNEGLNVLNPKTGIIDIYGSKDGLPNEVIYGILPDESGRLWLSTNNGICSINPLTMECHNYDVSDGLQSNEFNGGSFHKGHSGKLYFGGVYGLNILNPSLLRRNTKVNKPIITKLEVLGNEVAAMAQTQVKKGFVTVLDSQYVTDTNISYAEHITLNYSQRFFAIEYSGLNHLFPNKTKYAFQLLPMDKKWNKAGMRNYVSFANLKPDTYEFKVVSTNSDGVWGDDEARLLITILPPFWLTNWFILLELLILGLLVVFILRYFIKIKTNRLLLSQNQQIKEANIQLQQSEENLKQINATKDKFFSIISHDLKNPFSSLMSISDMLNKNFDAVDEEDRRAGVQRIHSSVKSIYDLLENLLTWSRSQRGKIALHKKPFDIGVLMNENINLYKMAAHKKDISITNDVSDTLLALGDRDTVSTIIRNLLGNAIKFTNTGGTIKLSVREQNSSWKVCVTDDGVGIKPEDQECLFCIDKKIKTEGTSGEKGTGLGLIICKEFAEKNDGEIGIESQEGKGSCFWFTIKKAP